MMTDVSSRVFFVAIPVSIFVGIVFFQSTLSVQDVNRYKFPTKPPSDRFKQNEKSLFKHDLCLLYDKPKRTGSTTVATTLQQCWLKNMNIPTPARKDAPLGPLENRIKLMLLLNEPVVMFALYHVHISDRDVRRLAYFCNDIFYITSTRPMQQRFTSFVKASALRKLAGPNNNVNTNTTISIEGLRQGAENLRFHAKRLEPYYETYPFTGSMRLKPDYVIRNQFIEQDTKLLLKAFGCPEEVASTNVHDTEHDTDEQLRDSEFEPFMSPEHIPGDETVSRTDSPIRVSRGTQTAKNLEPTPLLSRDKEWFWTVNITTMTEDDLLYFTKNFPVSMGDSIFKELTSLAESNNKNALYRIQNLMPVINAHNKALQLPP